MTIGMTPYLQFPGTAREAMTFYCSVLGGELDLLTYGEGMGATGETKDLIMHGSLYLARGVHLMGADLEPGGLPGNGLGTVALSDSEYDAADAESLTRWWHGLAEGAEIRWPFEAAPWGGTFGQLKDRFGVEWMIMVSEAEAA